MSSCCEAQIITRNLISQYFIIFLKSGIFNIFIIIKILHLHTSLPILYLYRPYQQQRVINIMLPSFVKINQYFNVEQPVKER